MIYLIQQGDDGPVKIGYTRDLKALQGRLCALRTGHAAELHLRAVMPGTREDEALLHRYFAGHRLRGEWFEPGPLIVHAAQGRYCALYVLDQAWSWFRLQEDGLVGSDGRLTHAGLDYVMALERNATDDGWELDLLAKDYVEAYADLL